MPIEPNTTARDDLAGRGLAAALADGLQAAGLRAHVKASWSPAPRRVPLDGPPAMVLGARSGPVRPTLALCVVPADVDEAVAHAWLSADVARLAFLRVVAEHAPLGLALRLTYRIRAGGLVIEAEPAVLGVAPLGTAALG